MPFSSKVKKTLKNDLKNWMKGGQNGIPAFFPADGYGGRKKSTPEIEDPPLPPTDGNGNGDGSGGTGGNTAPAVPKRWPEIVDHFFPRGGTGYKEGGLVRGGGAAVKGRGRGRIV